MIFLFLQGITNKRNDYRRWSPEPTQPMKASAGWSISDKLTEQMAAGEAQREFIFYLFFQKMVLFSFFIFLKNNYVF